MKVFILISLIFILFSCSEKKNNVLTKISVANQVSSLVGSPTLYLIGIKDSKVEFSEVITDQQKDFLIQSGQWKFLAIGWYGANPYQGIPYCDMAFTKIEGTESTVTFSLAQSKCQHEDFFKNGSIKPQIFLNCDSENLFPSEFGNSSDCSANEGSVVGLKFSLMNKLTDRFSHQSVHSNCMSFSASYIETSYFLPNSKYFPLNLSLYSDSSCNNLFDKIDLLSGLNGDYKRFKQFFDSSNIAHYNYIITSPQTGNLAITPYQNDLVHQFDASDSSTVTVVGSDVTSWKDKKNPAFVLNSNVGNYGVENYFNSKRIVTFNSTTKFYAVLPAPMSTQYGTYDGVTIVIAAKNTFINNQVRFLLKKTNGSTERDFEIYQGSSDFVTAGSTGLNFVYGNSQVFDVANKRDIFSLVVSTASNKVEIRNKDTAIIQTNSAPDDGLTNLGNILTLGDNTSAFEGDLYEILVYNRELTAAEISDVMIYLKTKWEY